MSANTFGHLFKIHSFGESHCPALGVVIDGVPSGIDFDFDLLTKELERRRPYFSSEIVSQRKEEDIPEVLSGVFEGKTLGTPICIMTRNLDARSQDYSAIKSSPRPGHADDVWKQKFANVDYRGGGRSSGRETVARVMGGAVARMFLQKNLVGYVAKACIHSVGDFTLTDKELSSFINSDLTADVYKSRFPSDRDAQLFDYFKKLQADGDSIGGTLVLNLKLPQKSLGQPVFHKLKADLAAAMMSIGATCGIEFGQAVKNLKQTGIQFHSNDQNYGGIRGGISTSEDLTVFIHFKPTSSILDVAKKGRHDPCILIRAIPVVESMAHLVIADHTLWQRLDNIHT